MKVSTVSEMKELDQIAIQRFGIPAELLMENAGHAAYTVLSKEFGVDGRRIAVFCGTGNNGGDGLVLARKIHSDGGEVRVFIIGDPSRFRGSARMNFDIISRLPIEIQQLDSLNALSTEMHAFDSVVDAIFGTGLTRTVQGLHHEVIDWINESGKPVMSIDIPSGIHGDTGRVMGIAVKAICTVTFGLPKLGNLLPPGYEFCGRLYVTHISFPPTLYGEESIKLEVNSPESWKPPLDWKDRAGALIIGIDPNTSAASHLSALTFSTLSGAPTYLAVAQSVATSIAGRGSGVTVVPQKETDGGCVSSLSESGLLQLSETTDLAILGPGSPTNQEARRLQRELVRLIETPVILYGDWIAGNPDNLDWIRNRKAGTVVLTTLSQTSRIIGKSPSKLENDRIDLLQGMSKDLNSIVVLEGTRSLIGCPNQSVFVNLSGGTWLTRAGSSALLSGTVASMYNPRVPLSEAVRKGVFAHGLAVDLSSNSKRKRDLTARVVLDCLREALEIGWSDLEEPQRNCYLGGAVIS